MTDQSLDQSTTACPTCGRPFAASAIVVHPDDLAELLRQTVPGQRYDAKVLIERYEHIVSHTDRAPASSTILGIALKGLGWTRGRRAHGSVRTWTRPEVTS